MRARGRVISSGVLLAVLAALLLSGCGDDKSDEGKATPTGADLASASAEEDREATTYRPTGSLLADSAFRPESNGFGFENYTNDLGYQNLTPIELEHLFGAPACPVRINGACSLSPPGQAWMDTMNQLMGGGHCYGFSLTALMMFTKVLNPLDYGGPAPPALPGFGNATLQRRIAESWVLQVLQRTQDGRIIGTPNEVLDALVAGIRDKRDTYTIGFFKRDGTAGHAVTPYAVEDKGGGKVSILIYDNNFPGVSRAMDFDRNSNTWRYQASVNPDSPTGLYEGDAASKTISLFPTKPQLGVHPCPFCSPTGSPRPSLEQVSLAADSANHGHLVLTDEQGRRTGIVDGRQINRIPGVRVVRITTAQNWHASPEPIYLVPRDARYSITLDGGDLEAADTESVSVIGRGYAATVSGIRLRPQETNRIQLTDNRRGLRFSTAAGKAQAPRISIGLEQRGRGLSFDVAAPAIAGGSSLSATANPIRRRLELDARDVRNTGSYDVAITEVTPAGRRRARGDSVRLEAGESALFGLRRR